jgi:phage terminase large subunit GpA-like protein
MTIPLKMIAIDSGYLTQRVYMWARKHKSRVMAVKGMDHMSTILGMAKTVDINWQGRNYYNSVKLWPVGVSTLKFELYSWLALKRPLKTSDPYPPGFAHFPEYSEEYFKMLTAEEYVPNLRKGGGKWEKLRRNEGLDVRIYARAAASRIGLDTMTPNQWNNLRGQLKLPSPEPTATVPRKRYFKI